jgi:acetyltransferase-like isoleucine patch superfamily enzyme
MHDRAVLAARGALFQEAQADTIYRGNPATAVGPRGLKLD